MIKQNWCRSWNNLSILERKNLVHALLSICILTCSYAIYICILLPSKVVYKTKFFLKMPKVLVLLTILWLTNKTFVSLLLFLRGGSMHCSMSTCVWLALLSSVLPSHKQISHLDHNVFVWIYWSPNNFLVSQLPFIFLILFFWQYNN